MISHSFYSLSSTVCMPLFTCVCVCVRESLLVTAYNHVWGSVCVCVCVNMHCWCCGRLSQCVRIMSGVLVKHCTV